MRRSADRHLELLHDLEQGGLDLGRRAVDLVREQEVGEHGAELGPQLAAVGLPDARADEVGRHEVGRELDAAVGAAEHAGERAHGERLREAGHALEQHVAAGEQGDEDLLEHVVLADDDPLALPQGLLEAAAGLGRGIGVGIGRGDERAEAFHGGQHGPPAVTSP